MKTKFIPFVVLLATLTLFVGQNSVLADRVVFQPGSSVGKDMWFSSVYNTTAVDDNKLQVGGWGDQYRTLLRFDLTGLPQTATSAYMYLYTYPRGDSSTPVSMNIYILTVDWNEQTQYYYTPLYGYFGGTHPAPTVNSWYGINITGIYNAWKAGTYTNYGFAFLPTATDNRFNMFRSSDYSDYYYRPMLVVDYNGANLGFPLSYNSWTPYTASIVSVFDHQMDTPYDFNEDSEIVAYTDEVGDYSPHPNDYTCINQQSGQPFTINGHYVGYSGCGSTYYLSYNSHPGYDYPVPTGTSVYASASGTITEIQCPAYPGSCTDYGRIRISHSSGYSTWYMHLSQQVGNLIVGSTVSKGQRIGYSGQTSPVSVGPHLHFEVRKNDGSHGGYGQPVDPYGWQGEYGTDPMQISGHDNVCLWDSCQ